MTTDLYIKSHIRDTHTQRTTHLPSALLDKGQYESDWTDITSDHIEMCGDTGSLPNPSESPHWLLHRQSLGSSHRTCS